MYNVDGIVCRSRPAVCRYARDCLTFRTVSLEEDDHVETYLATGSSMIPEKSSLRFREFSSAYSLLSDEVCHISMWCGSCTPSQMLPAKAASP